MQLTRFTAALACGALAACVPPAPQPTPAPTATTAAAPRPAQPAPAAVENFAHWQDAPQTPGDWHYRAAGREQFADFRSPAGGQIAQLACTAARDVSLTVYARAPGATSITIRTEHTDRALRAVAGETSVSAVAAASDPLLDAVAFTKGRFAVIVPGGPQLFLPSWPEVIRVIEECR